MREIKFRAWQTVTKTMFLNIEKGTGEPHGNPPFADYLENQNMVVMQYTGLKDKNGKEICEGDIVLGFDSGYYRQPQKMKIEYRTYPYAGWYMVPADNLRPHLMDDSQQETEVIGNIYENPELLTN
jgi:uncharacterized phage protein (TIGR01671 family)